MTDAASAGALRKANALAEAGQPHGENWDLVAIVLATACISRFLVGRMTAANSKPGSP
jgi:hypothetical protein